MANDKDSTAAQSAASLYGWWMETLPTLFAGLAPGSKPWEMPSAAAAGKRASDAASPPPFPVDQIVQALHTTEQTFGPLYQAYAQALAGNLDTQSTLGQMSLGGEAQTKHFVEVLARCGQAMNAWMTVPTATRFDWSELLAHDHGVFGPLMMGAERTFGAVADAFGLAPSRELRNALQTMREAVLSKQQAQAEYFGVVSRIWAQGVEGLLSRLAQMSARGESVDTVSDLVRLWAKAADEAAHVAMQSDEGLQASAKLIRAATRYRQAAHRVVEIVSETMNVPTRTDVDAAYREIQQLKRELRQLRKSIATQGARPAPKRKGTKK